MKKKFVIGLVCCVAMAALSGCVNTVDGHSKAGVPFMKDRIESRYERSLSQVMNAAREALKTAGTIISDDVVINTLKASVNTRTVFVKCEEIDPKVTRVIVQVRTKGGGKDIDLAAEIDKQIALQVKN